MKILPGNHWNWVSFPRMNRIGDNSIDAKIIFPDFHDWPLQISFLYENNFSQNPTMEFNNICGEWDPSAYYIYSSYGYKLNPQKKIDNILEIHGERLPLDHKLERTLPALRENWLGYWIPYSQNIKDALGVQLDNVFGIEAENWFYTANTQFVFSGQELFAVDISHLDTPSTSIIDKHFEYGKSYIIYFFEPVVGFQWQNSNQRMVIEPYPEPSEFKEIQTPEYHIIDILDIPEEVVEIGIYVNDECYSAKTIQNNDEQFLVHKKWDHRGNTPYQFRILKKNMQIDTLEIIPVYNKKLDRFEENKLMAGETKYSIIKLFGNEQ